jgi:hypothetical protein
MCARKQMLDFVRMSVLVRVCLCLRVRANMSVRLFACVCIRANISEFEAERGQSLVGK